MIETITNIKDSLIEKIKINPPLIYENNNNKIILKFTKNIFLKIIIDNDNRIICNLPEDSQIITPNFNYRKNKFTFNYKELPLTDDTNEDFRIIIIQIQSSFLIINFNFRNDISIIKENNKIFFEFSILNSLEISCFDKLRDFYTKINNEKSLNPLWLYGLGIFEDNRHNTETFKLFKTLNTEFIYFILKDWFNNNQILDGPYKLENKINNYLINNINFILSYDNKLFNSKDNQQHFLKLRKGELSTENDKVFLDFFNDRGKEELNNIYIKIKELKAKGLFLDSIYYKFKDKNIYEKSICKYNNKYYDYSSKISTGIKIINDLIDKKFKTNIFLSNLLSPDSDKTIFIKKVTKNFNDSLNNIEEYYNQGFINFGLHFQDDITNQKRNNNFFVFLLFVPLIIFDKKFITIIRKNSGDFYSLLLYFIDLRFSLRILFDNIITEFIEKGIMPVKIDRGQNKERGIFIGDYLYTSFYNETLIDKTYYVPEGNWYSLEDNIIIKGNANFANRKKNLYAPVFIKEGKIFQYKIKREYEQELFPKKTRFYIFLPIELNDGYKIESKIIERILFNNNTISINHFINIKIINNEIIINYESSEKENLDRTFIFHIIIKDITIEKLLENKMKLLFKKDKMFIEYSKLNKKNRYEFRLIFKIKI